MSTRQANGYRQLGKLPPLREEARSYSFQIPFRFLSDGNFSRGAAVKKVVADFKKARKPMTMILDYDEARVGVL